MPRWRGDALELDAAVGHPEQRTAPLLRARDAGAVADERAAEALGRAPPRRCCAAGAAPYLAAAERSAPAPTAVTRRGRARHRHAAGARRPRPGSSGCARAASTPWRCR